MQKENETLKTYSTGGFGDFFIVYLKLLDEARAGRLVKHLHIESNEVVPNLVRQFHDFSKKYNVLSKRIQVETACISNYSNVISGGEWQGRQPKNTHCLGLFNYPSTDVAIKYPFFDFKNPLPADEKKISLQVSAGANHQKKWAFDVLTLKRILESKGYEVFLVGNNPKFQSVKTSNNFTNISLEATLLKLEDVNIHIGCFGFLTYYSSSRKIKNIYLPDGEEFVNHYIHPEWREFSHKLTSGLIKEVVDAVSLYD